MHTRAHEHTHTLPTTHILSQSQKWGTFSLLITKRSLSKIKKKRGLGGRRNAHTRSYTHIYPSSNTYPLPIANKRHILSANYKKEALEACTMHMHWKSSLFLLSNLHMRARAHIHTDTIHTDTLSPTLRQSLAVAVTCRRRGDKSGITLLPAKNSHVRACVMWICATWCPNSTSLLPAPNSHLYCVWVCVGMFVCVSIFVCVVNMRDEAYCPMGWIWLVGSIKL